MAESAEKAFEDRFHQNWERVHSLLSRLVGDASEADDLALEVFWRLYRSPPGYGSDSEVTAWLFRVATNLGYNHLRSRRRRQHYELAGGKLESEEAERNDPAREAQRREEAALVNRVLRGLKRRQVQLITLRYSGFSYAEIADILRVSPASVGKLLSRAEAAFEKRYTDLEGLNHDPSE